MTPTFGDCILTRVDEHRIRVDQADPRIWISEELLEDMNHPDVELHGGGVLIINGVNRRVVYRIDYTRTHPQWPNLIYAEWPD